MENAHTDFENRLRAHAERLMQALESQAIPETYGEILRAARALIAVKKALDLLYTQATEIETKARPTAKAKEPAKTAETEPASEDDDEPVLNRQMRRMAEALARKQVKAGDYRRFGSG